MHGSKPKYISQAHELFWQTEDAYLISLQYLRVHTALQKSKIVCDSSHGLASVLNCPLLTRRKIFFLFLIGFVSYSVESRGQLDTTRFIAQEGWIEKMDNLVNIKLSVSNDTEDLFVDADGIDYDFYANTSTIGRLNFIYRIISFSIKFAPAFFPGNGDEDVRGKTKSFGISAGLTFPHWFHNFSISQTKGFYLNNTRDFDPTWNQGDPYLQVPNLKHFTIEGMTGYSFNPKYSVRSLTTQAERQLKSAGSFIPVLGYRYYLIDNKDNDATSRQKSNNFEFFIGAGYHYTFVLKEKFYLSCGLTPGVGYILTKLTTYLPSETIVSHSHSPIFRSDGRIALGYNGRRSFAGGLLNIKVSSFQQEGTTAINTEERIDFHVFVGVRINAPKSLRQVVDNIPMKK